VDGTNDIKTMEKFMILVDNRSEIWKLFVSSFFY